MIEGVYSAFTLMHIGIKWTCSPISSYSPSAEKCSRQSCVSNALLAAKRLMNHRRPRQILPQSDPCASPAEIMRIVFTKSIPGAFTVLQNRKLRLVKVQWSKYKNWRVSRFLLETILRSLFRNIGQNQTSARSHRGCAISPAFSPASRP